MRPAVSTKTASHPLPLGSLDRLRRDVGGILLVSPLEERDAEAFAVRSQLLNGAGSKRVARGDHHLDVVLQEPVRNLGQVG